MNPRIVIAGTGSGSGKTTVTVGLLQAFKNKGLQAQGFKCGPDYIDPSYHTAVTGRASRNTDSWMLGEEGMKDVFRRGSGDADISVIEGVMGMYDGKSPTSDQGSTAEVSQMLEAPVILVVNISSMARSAAAIVKGFQSLSDSSRIAGVLLNMAGNEGHAKLCQTAIEQECNVPVVGFLLRGDVPAIPERHLGLIPAIERGELDGFFAELGTVMAERIDMDRIYEIAASAPDREWPVRKPVEPKHHAVIAVAYDAAFNFYYPENLELLEESGAELVYFKPLADEPLPAQADGLYIGGGFPEEFAEELAGNQKTKTSIHEALKEKLPVYAECGGYMYLGDTLTTTDGIPHEMLGIIPVAVTMQTKLASLGYREITALDDSVIMRRGTVAKGHEFHYSTAEEKADWAPHHEVKAMRGTKQEGYYTDHITAGYTHLHFGSNPSIPARFVEKAAAWREKKQKKQQV
ncbi:cobyrinate a,c-diamide synthase [Sinobaca sp. H24]|uniref:cobyrinate a,c-diamide synthase n=1 Tax=Sinobaca sp. H24 TaxID=2923376 RepID=UPI0020792800|nr:cobyrinate a,c-diamide synthase [Sinobaca sp. H24]